MKRIMDIGDLGATYIEHDTPIVKPTIYKPKPSGANIITPSPSVDPAPSWTPPGGDPNRPRPSPTPPRPSPPAPPRPPPPAPLPPSPPAAVVPYVPERPRETNALPWVIAAFGVVLAGSVVWAVRYTHTPEDAR